MLFTETLDRRLTDLSVCFTSRRKQRLSSAFRQFCVDLVVTPANVIAGTSATFDQTIAGVTITAGQTYYKDAADSNKAKLSDANVVDKDLVTAIALHDSRAGQPIRGQTGGNINPGATVVVGTVYYLSATPGGIAPYADLVTGDKVTRIGIGTTASNILLDINRSGIVKP